MSKIPVNDYINEKKRQKSETGNKSLCSFPELPIWIEQSEFVKQFRIDYPEETIQLNKNLVFELPQRFTAFEEIIQSLEACRFFGINDWKVIIMVLTYILDEYRLDESLPQIEELQIKFPEFENIWISFRFLSANGLNEFICGECAQEGHLVALRFAFESGCTWNGACELAASGGHLDCLKYAHENGCPWSHSTCRFAAHGGHLHCLQYAHINGCPWDESTCCEAASSGHLNCLQYAHNNGCPWDESTLRDSARGGHLNCLIYAHQQGCEWGQSVCVFAARGGHLDCLTYAHENGCLWDEATCRKAARGGHLSCLEYAHNNGCPWDESACREAALEGQLDCLIYAYENGCPWNELTHFAAAKGGHLDCLQYSIENGCPWSDDIREKAISEATLSGQTQEVIMSISLFRIRVKFSFPLPSLYAPNPSQNNC
mmetsp:Transcript_23494/g.30572  ORF Transcript_23494/g.30572 Transcript_23494/m.30572 type:complete len:430 (-) Transcript_23494:218-1507(-)